MALVSLTSFLARGITITQPPSLTTHLNRLRPRLIHKHPQRLVVRRDEPLQDRLVEVSREPARELEEDDGEDAGGVDGDAGEEEEDDADLDEDGARAGAAAEGGCECPGEVE